MSSAPAPAALLPRICAGCQDVVPLAVTASAGTFYLGWICPGCLAADTEQDVFSEEYHASLEPLDPEVDAVPSWA